MLGSAFIYYNFVIEKNGLQVYGKLAFLSEGAVAGEATISALIFKLVIMCFNMLIEVLF